MGNPPIEKPRRALGDSRCGDASDVAAGMGVLHLMSPLGWMNCIPLLIPTFAAVIPSRRHISVICLAVAILWVPSSVLARNTFGPLATATIASPYTWGLLLLWAAVCLDSSIESARESSQQSTSSNILLQSLP
jgi:hypothetical protein